MSEQEELYYEEQTSSEETVTVSDEEADGEQEEDEESGFEDIENEEEAVSDFVANGQYYVLKSLEGYIDPHPSQEKLEWIVDKYNNGTDAEREEALTQMYGILCCYIWHYLNKSFGTYMKMHAEDLFSQAELGVLDGMKTYDAKKSKPSTWFKRPIQHQILVYINEYIGHTTSHYTAAEKQIAALIKKKEAAGIPYTARDLYIETGVPIKTIQTIMDAKSVSVASINAADKDFDIASNSISPERMFIDQEEMRFLQDIILGNDEHPSQFSEQEQKVLCYTHGLFGCEELNSKQMSVMLGVSPNKVNFIYRQARARLEAILRKKTPSSGKRKEKKPQPGAGTVSGAKLTRKEMEEDLLLVSLDDEDEYEIRD